MPRTVAEMVSEATAQIAHVSPQDAAASRVIVYCRSGVRAALTLTTMGYENVANLDGGIIAWQEAGLPTVEHHSDVYPDWIVSGLASGMSSLRSTGDRWRST